MNNIDVFFNNAFVSTSGVSGTSVAAFGDWCLTPVRCLFDGNKVTFSYDDGSPIVVHEKEYATSYESRFQPKRNFLRVLAAIVLLVPGVIIGSAFKGLGYLSQSIRNRHHLAVLHHTSVDRTIGSPDQRLSLAGITQQLDELKKRNLLHQPAENLVIYAEIGTRINGDPGFLNLNPKKIILVGARIVRDPHGGFDDRLDDILKSQGWENVNIASVADALKDVPPKISQFSFKRYHRVYNIV